MLDAVHNKASPMTGFDALTVPDMLAELRSLVLQIPRGHVASYGAIARALGDVGAAKWIALELADPAFASNLPAHRVVRQTGEPGKFHNPAPDAQIQQLTSEGVQLKQGRVDLASDGFNEFNSNQPLKTLQQQQEALQQRFQPRAYAANPQRVAAVDVAYPASGLAQAAYIEFDTRSGTVTFRHCVQEPVRFPYISGYLAYRELPIYQALWSSLPDDLPPPEVLLVDGNGLLHPRRCGIAVQLGVLTDCVTIGVGKKLMCGRTELEKVTPTSPQPILDKCRDDPSQTELLGMTLCNSAGSNPVFVSPGQFIDVPSAARVTQSLFREHRLPEPVFHADQASRQATLQS